MLVLTASTAHAANYYYNGNNSNEWHDLLNWFTDVDFTTPAGELPGPADDAYIEASVGIVNPAVTVANLFIAQSNHAEIDSGSADITVTGTTTVGNNGGASGYIGGNVTIHGNAVFGLSTYNAGIINGNATFNNSDSYNTSTGIITGNAIFNDGSHNEGSVETNAIFNDTTHNLALITATTTFNDESTNQSTVTSLATTTFNGGSVNTSTGVITNNAEFYATSTNSAGNIVGTAVFYEDSATNSGGVPIDGTAIFHDNTVCNDTPILGDAHFYDNSSSFCGVSGTTTFYGNDSDVTFFGGNDDAMQTKVRRYTSNATTTRDFSTNVSYPWTIVADGAVVNIAGASVGSSILSPINSGRFITDVPTVTTASASSLSTTGATLNGEITDTGVVIEGGEGNVDQHGFAYGTVANLSTVIATTSLGTLGSTTFDEAISGLTCGTTYYYRSYAANSGGTGYGSIVSFSTSACPAGVPSLSLSAVSSLTTTSVTLNASITDDGGASSTDRGFHWGTTSSYGSVASTTGTFGVGAFSESLSGLTCAVTYYYRAFGINSSGTATTSGSTFTTSACPAPEEEQGGGGSSSSGSSRKVSDVWKDYYAQLLAPQLQSVQNPPQLPSYPPIITPFVRNLAAGSSGLDVQNLQKYLNAKGFTVALTGPGSPGNETSMFGALTRAALARFQKANNIYPPVGFFGPITRAFITKNP